jgi:hypothetical protein
MGPKIELTIEGLLSPHPVNKVRYFKVGLKNIGFTSANSAIVYIRIDSIPGRDFIPKWDAVPEATGNQTAFLFDAFQRIDIAPGGIHKELVPVFIIPTALLSGKDYVPKNLYIFSTFYHYTSKETSEIQVKPGKHEGEIHIACENYYAKFLFTLDFDIGTQELKVEISSALVNKWIYRKAKVERT